MTFFISVCSFVKCSVCVSLGNHELCMTGMVPQTAGVQLSMTFNGIVLFESGEIITEGQSACVHHDSDVNGLTRLCVDFYSDKQCAKMTMHVLGEKISLAEDCFQITAEL